MVACAHALRGPRKRYQGSGLDATMYIMNVLFEATVSAWLPTTGLVGMPVPCVLEHFRFTGIPTASRFFLPELTCASSVDLEISKCLAV